MVRRIRIHSDFSHDAIIRVDRRKAGQQAPRCCGMKFDWLPVLPPSDNTSTLYGSVSYRIPGSSWQESPTVRSSRWKTASIIHGAKAPAHHFQLHACPRMRLPGCDLLVLGNDPQITKEGMLNGLYASWIEASHKTNADVTYHYLLLYDPEKLCGGIFLKRPISGHSRKKSRKNTTHCADTHPPNRNLSPRITRTSALSR